MMAEAGCLTGKRCLIVGGTSGLGRAAALRFLQEGARLVVAGLPPADRPAASDLPAGVWVLDCDATSERDVERLFAEAQARLGGLDVLYHVAGASGRPWGDGPLATCSLSGWQATLQANLTSVFLTNRAAVGAFRTGGRGGVILNMASVLALAPAPDHFDTCAYTAAKGGVVALSRLAAARHAAEHIRVNVIAPGLIDTPMSARACGDPAIVKYLTSKQPLAAGPGRPEDCADAAVFLCSDAARLITGVVLPVDGGWCVCEGQPEH
jgi:NAD(P)-dependent dehydrogenase (short-subunit alcohol dehydrogenase family)